MAIPNGEMSVVASLVKTQAIMRQQIAALAQGMAMIQNQVTILTKAVRPIGEVPNEAESTAPGLVSALPVKLRVIGDQESVHDHAQPKV